MSDQTSARDTSPGHRRFGTRGESLLAPVWIVVAGIVAMGTGASAWWSLRTQNVVLATARAEQVLAAGQMLSQATENLLAAGELTAARNLVAEAARLHGYSQCSVVLADGTVLADADPAKITQRDWPIQWPGAVSIPDGSEPVVSHQGDAVAISYPLWVVGRGEATLKIRHEDIREQSNAQWETQAGVGAIGVAAMASLLLAYRQQRVRVRTMSLIGEALLVMEEGEAAESALTLDESLGPHARAFNRVLSERQVMRERLLLRQAEETLGVSEHRGGELAGVCDALRQGLLLIDHKGHVRYANGAAAVYLQAKRDQMVGAEVRTWISEASLMEAVQSCLDGPTRQRHVVEIDRTREGGIGLLRFNVRSMQRNEKPACLIVIEDVTQQRVAEDARTTFVAHATHELRMPLTNIRLYLETALDDGEKDPKLRGECLNVINQETQRLERLVGDMLSITEIESGSLKVEKDDVRLDAMFESLEADYQAAARDKQIALTFHLPPKMPVIQGDRDKIVMAMHNLVGNALKYTPENGKVDLNIEVEPNRLVVEVKDTGIGIGPDDLPKVFEKFYRARDMRVNDITGSGLGLALAREVIRLHGGDITVDSEINKGSVFTLTLPIATEQ